MKNKNKKKNKVDHTLELVLADGRRKSFTNGYAMWKWANQATNWQFELKNQK